MSWYSNNVRLLVQGLKGLGYLASVGMLVSFPALGALSEPLKVRGAQYGGDLPTLIANSEGFFEAADREIEVSFGHVGKANLAALRRGEVDYALMAMTPFVLDRMQDPTPGEVGDPIILANLSHGASNLKIITRADGQMAKSRGAKNLAGKRVGLSRGTNAEYLWFLFAEHHKIDRSQLEIVDVSSERIGDALAADEIDAAVIWASWLPEIKSKVDFQLAFFDQDIEFLYASRWILVTTQGVDTIDVSRHAAVLRGYLKAIEWIQRHPELAMNRFRKAWGIGTEEADVLKLQDAIFDATLDWSLYASYHQQLAWARRAGYPDMNGSGAFLTSVKTDPLRALSPSSVLLPFP